MQVMYLDITSPGKQKNQKLPEYMGQIFPGSNKTSWAVPFGSQEDITLGCGEACLGRTLGIRYCGPVISLGVHTCHGSGPVQSF